MPDATQNTDAFEPLSTAPCEPRGGMVGVPFPDGSCYLMDARPVSQGEYHAAVQVAPLVSDHPACAGASPGVGPRTAGGPGEPSAPDRHVVCFRTAVLQQEPSESDLRLPWPPDNNPSNPMVCVTWCDAHAYCDRLGKRLCQVRADPSTPYSKTLLENVERSEFANACTGSGRVRFPMGNRYTELTSEQLNGLACGFFGALGWFWLMDPDCPDWEGAYRGVFSIGRAIEYLGPWPWSILHPDSNYGTPPNADPLSGCSVLTDEAYLNHLVPLMEANEQRRYDGVTTFRCCADFDAFE